MSNQKIQKFSVIGISVRTSNENGQSAKDIPALWNKLMSEGIVEKIPNKMDRSIYCIYTEYEKDHTKPYTTILACKVTNLDSIPDGMIGKTFEEANYSRRIAKGNILQGMVLREWTNIWNSDLPRAYTADFEIYDEKKAQDMENAEVEIFVAIK
jgi:predicted transcriptional regulator YdeE